MDLKETVDMHSKRLEQHDKELDELRQNNAKEIKEVKDEIKNWNETLNSGLARVDENNKFLREQNNTILMEIIGRNKRSDEQRHERMKIKWQTVLQISLVIFGSGGLIYTIIDLLLETVK